jgi:hypothetical protein
MEKEKLIPLNECCKHYNIELSFISSVREFGLLEITSVDEEQFIYTSQLQKLEKLIRLHYELEINMEGIEAITNLLIKVDRMQQEITHLKNKLSVLSTRDLSYNSASL